MKIDNTLLTDIVLKGIKSREIVLEESRKAFVEFDDIQDKEHKLELRFKQEEIDFLKEIREEIALSSNGLNYLKTRLMEYENKGSDYSDFILLSKYEIIEDLIKEYKVMYKKNNKNSKSLGLNGLFDNDLFCNIIKRKIHKYTHCNKVTMSKYQHLSAFLNELLVEMENSKDPLKTLKQKIKIYEKHRNVEAIKINNRRETKANIIRSILNEYSKSQMEARRCR